MARRPTVTAESASEDSKAAAEARRKSFRIALRDDGLRPSGLARLAELPSPNSLYNFLSGRSRSLQITTWAQLLPHLPRSNPQILMGLTEHTATPHEEENCSVQARARFTAEQDFTLHLVVANLLELKDNFYRLQQEATKWTLQIEGLKRWLPTLTEHLPPKTRQGSKATEKQ